MRHVSHEKARLFAIAVLFTLFGWMSAHLSFAESEVKLGKIERSLDRIADTLEKLETRKDLTKRYQ